MASWAIHNCSSTLTTYTARTFSSSTTSTTNRTIPSRKPSFSSSSATAAARMQHRQQTECNDENVNRRRTSNGSKGSVESELSSSSVSPSSTASPVYHRREIFYLVSAAAGMGAQMLFGGWKEATAAAEEKEQVEPAPTPPAKSFLNDDKPDTTITDKVYFDLSICPNASRQDRTLGNTSQVCTVGEPLGRIVIGLYGRQVPQTVSNFKAMITGAAGTSYAGTIFHRVLAGQYIQGGRQGSKEKGEVSGVLLKLERNQETVSSKSYKLVHSRPGTVSLALAENDDDEDLKLDLDYRNVQFLITTGPGPAPQLDNGNIVFGTVLEGLDVVAAVANVPTYKPSKNIKQFNDFASFLGDERAANARNFWDRPLKTVVISGCGEIPLGLPVFPPGLP